jgi:uncharacterized surface protein with fasciclin (FAS1) repeats
MGAVAAAAALLLTGCATADDGGATTGAAGPTAVPTGASGETAQGPTVLDVAASDENLSTFVEAVEAAGLEQTLALPGPLTVFAPSNEAFEALPEGLLDELLKPDNSEPITFIVTYHVVEDELTSSQISDGTVVALSGQPLTLTTANGVQVNDASVVEADLGASNGVVHVIDEVLIPPDVDPQALLAGP